MVEKTISYSVENEIIFRNAIKRVQKSVGDLKIPFALIASDWFKSNKSIFALKGPGGYPPFKNSIAYTKISAKTGRPYGSAVTTNKSPYQIHKIKTYGFDYPLLRARGILEQSVTQIGSDRSVYENDGKGLLIGSKVPWGIFHQSDRPRKKIPLRKFIFIGPEAARFAPSSLHGRGDRWLQILETYMAREMGKEFKTAVKESRAKLNIKDIKP